MFQISSPRFISSLFSIATALFVSIPLEGAEIKITKDIAHKSDEDLSAYEKERCKLDLYVPAGAKDFPCLVWFHGGGLMEGDKSNPTVLRALAEEGLVVVSANYRLSPQ